MMVVFTMAAGPLWGLSRVPSEQEVVPGKVLVKFQDDVASDRVADILDSEGVTVKSVLASTGVHIIILPEGMDVFDAVERFSSYPEVQYVEPVQKASPLEEK